jgi:hypothetical protein
MFGSDAQLDGTLSVKGCFYAFRCLRKRMKLLSIAVPADEKTSYVYSVTKVALRFNELLTKVSWSK